MTKFEKISYTALIVLIIFTFGVQVGIYQGRIMQTQEFLNDN